MAVASKAKHLDLAKSFTVSVHEVTEAGEKMKGLRHLLMTSFLIVPLLAGAQAASNGTQSSPNQGATTPNTNQAGGQMASSSAIKILSPKAGEKIGSSAVSVSYELLNDNVSASGSPNFRIQLDGRDPVETTSTEYSFSGLPAGTHVLSVEVVDANHTPIMGSRTEVHFTTANQLPAGGNQSQPGQQPPKGQAAPPTNQQPQPPAQPREPQAQPRAELQPPNVHKASLPLPEEALPSAAGELPLLSMVGFGVLVGGIISATRTRR
jgi:hypothetical protein